MSRGLNIPISTLYHVLKHKDQITEKYINMSQNMNGVIEKQIKYRKFIYETLKHPSQPITLDKIDRKFFSTFNVHLNKRELKSFIKNDLKYTFKKGSPSVNKANDEITKTSKKLFSTYLLQYIMEDKYIINVDEVSFSRNLINNYSWLPSSQTSQIINKVSKGSWSIVTGLWSDGEYFAVIFYFTIKSNQFCSYLSLLKYALTHSK